MVGSNEISEIGAERPTFFRNLKAVSFGECNIWDETTGDSGPRRVTSPTVGSSPPFGTSSVLTAAPNFAKKMIDSQSSKNEHLEVSKNRGLTEHLPSKPQQPPVTPCTVWPLVWYWNHLPAPADHPWGHSGWVMVFPGANFISEEKDIFTNIPHYVKGNGEG